MKNKQKGFSLIELLVVIAIIGIIASIIFISVKDTKEKARDSRRIMDLHQIQVALEMYLDEYGDIPRPGDYGENEIFGVLDYSYMGDFMQFLKGRVVGYPLINPDNIQFMSEVPKDPINSSSYVYYYIRIPDPDPYYELGAGLENGEWYVIHIEF